MPKLRLLIYLLLLIALPAEAVYCPRLFSGLVPKWQLNRRVFGNYTPLLSDSRAHAYGIADALGEAIRRELEKMGFNPPHRVSEWRIDSSMYSGRRIWDHRYALSHSGMPKALEEMKKAGYELVVDRGLIRDFTEGASNAGSRRIKLLPHTSWPVFQHELQHMRNSELGIAYGYYPTGQELKPGSREAKAIAMAKRLNAKGFGSLAVDETMAVKREITELEKIGYMPWSGPVYNARKYAWKFQKESLEEKTLYGRGTKEQRARLQFLRVKEQLLRPSLVRTALGIGAGTVYYYNDELEQFLVPEGDGVWKTLSFEKFEPAYVSRRSKKP